jgi:hypothetical protein
MSGLRKPWSKGVSGNPRGRPKGSGTVELHRVFANMLAVEDEKTCLSNMEQIFLRLMDDIRSPARRASAARILLAWGVGMPQQMVKVTQAIDMRIDVAPGIDNIDLEHLENVQIFRPEREADAS